METYYPSQSVLDEMNLLNNVSHIVIHHTAGSQKTTLEGLKNWFVVGRASEGYKWIGYHFLCFPNGEVVQTRPLDKQGGHVKSFNDKSIGIALIGDYEKTEPSEVMWESLEGLTKSLQSQFNIPPENVITHAQASELMGLSGTLCPGLCVIQRIKEGPTVDLKGVSSKLLVAELIKRINNKTL